MADIKVSALATPTGGASISDLLYIVDVSDTADGASGSGRKCTINDLPVPASVEALVAASVSSSLLTCGIPVGIPSSGSIGANGALSNIAAFPTTFNNPGVFLYFPVGAVYAGSAAGFYWTVMSSTTAGTVYDNILVVSAPAIPASPTAVVSAGPGVYTQTTVEVTALTATLYAAQVDSNASIRVVESTVVPVNGNTKSVRHRLNNTILWYRNPATYNFETHEFVMVCRGLQNQVTSKSDVSLVNAGNSVLGQYTAIDLTVDRTYAVTLQLSSASDYIVIDCVKAEVIK
jgi:hypothetical protein